VEEFLACHPRVTFHFTPSYSSWLNQIELWFSKLERDVIARGIFTSCHDLKQKIRRYLRHYNKTVKPFKWSYRHPSQRIKPRSHSNVTVR
jgi:transposase